MSKTNLKKDGWQGPSPIELLEHEDVVVRVEFVHGLGLEGHPGSLPLLVKALHDPQREVRQTAVWAMKEIAPALVKSNDPQRIKRDLALAF